MHICAFIAGFNLSHCSVASENQFIFFSKLKNCFEIIFSSYEKTVSTVSKQFFSFVTEKQFQFVTETEKQFQLSFKLLLKLKNRFEFSFKLLLKLKNSFKTVSTVMKLFFRNCYDPPCVRVCFKLNNSHPVH